MVWLQLDMYCNVALGWVVVEVVVWSTCLLARCHRPSCNPPSLPQHPSRHQNTVGRYWRGSPSRSLRPLLALRPLPGKISCRPACQACGPSCVTRSCLFGSTYCHNCASVHLQYCYVVQHRGRQNLCICALTWMMVIVVLNSSYVAKNLPKFTSHFHFTCRIENFAVLLDCQSSAIKKPLLTSFTGTEHQLW